MHHIALRAIYTNVQQQSLIWSLHAICPVRTNDSRRAERKCRYTLWQYAVLIEEMYTKQRPHCTISVCKPKQMHIFYKHVSRKKKIVALMGCTCLYWSCWFIQIKMFIRPNFCTNYLSWCKLLLVCCFLHNPMFRADKFWNFKMRRFCVRIYLILTKCY